MAIQFESLEDVFDSLYQKSLYGTQKYLFTIDNVCKVQKYESLDLFSETLIFLSKEPIYIILIKRMYQFFIFIFIFN